MGEQRVQFVAFNRGLISKYALARIDLQRMHMSAEVMRNWMPRVFGSMMLRPGLGYTGLGPYNNQQSKCIPFVRATNDAVRLEFTDSNLRVLIADTPITRPAVTAAITNGTFNTDLTGWTDSDESGAVSAWATGGYMSLLGTGFASAIRTQAVICNEPGTEHALRIVIARGPVRLRVGTASGDENFVEETSLGTGTHSIAFTPSGNFVVYFANRRNNASLVDSVAIEGAGVMVLPTPYPSAQIDYLRADQSADVLYLCDGSVEQRKIERHAARSWSIVLYEPEDGPFLIINTSKITLTPSGISGDITLAASDNVFKTGHINALFRLSSNGQFVEVVASGQDQWSGAVRVTGVGNQRKFTWVVSGTYSGTVSVQSSTTGEDGPWENFDSTTGTGSHTANDGLDNQIVWYRIGIAAGDYVSGTATGTISYAGGSLTGIVWITTVTDAKNAAARVLSPLGSTAATSFWYEGSWSDYRGWPSEVKFHEGRLWWMGNNKYFGSVSDAYESFDDTVLGDNGPIQRTIGKGPVDTINWSLSMQRLLTGTDGAEISARSDSFDTPLTPTNFNLKFPSTQGSKRVAAVQIDEDGYFVQRIGWGVYKMSWVPGQSLDYTSSDMTAICDEIGKPGVAQLAVQRQPDTRLHCRRTDGTVALLVLDDLEQVQCWIDLETDGLVEDICVLPGVDEDVVYYTVNRTINGTPTRFYEQWALESDCRGATLNKQADSFVIYNGAATNVLSAPHLIGKDVVVWADGCDLSPGVGDDQKIYRVDGAGHVTLDAGVTAASAVIGLPYIADFQSVKMAYAAQLGSALGQQKRIGTLAVLAADMHYQGLQYGHSLTEAMDDLPLVVNGIETPANTVWAEFDDGNYQFPGEWGPDERLCLRASAPRPCNLLAAVVYMDTEG